MRVLILGGAGMLGHKVWQTLRGRFDTWTTLRASMPEVAALNLFDPRKTLAGIDAAAPDSLLHAFTAVRPSVVVNCIGIVKQRPSAKDPVVTITVNSVVPHRLAALCAGSNARLIHISTDCVFSGKAGGYREADTPDAEDLYGRSKLLGEPHEAEPSALTLRTSIVGRELRSSTGVTEWFLDHRGGTVPGFTRAVFSGLTTIALARIIGDVIEHHPYLRGLYHVSSAPITKFELLERLNIAFNAAVTIEPSDSVRVDRSLDSRRFWQATRIPQPAWDAMVADMAADLTPYDQWRNSYAS
jgi:dTDP-4-dehydrorhamnose reductase